MLHARSYIAMTVLSIIRVNLMSRESVPGANKIFFSSQYGRTHYYNPLFDVEQHTGKNYKRSVKILLHF